MPRAQPSRWIVAGADGAAKTVFFFLVVGCVMNAWSGGNASGMILYTQCKEHAEGEGFMSASPGHKA